MRRRQLAERRPATGEFPRTRTTATQFSTRHEGFGGFPNPIFAIPALIKKKLDDRTRTINRTATQQSMPRTMTQNRPHALQRTGTIASGVYDDPRPVNYISFDAVVGRNSHFKSLTQAQEEELGGVEYRVSRFCLLMRGLWGAGSILARQNRCILLAWLSANHGLDDCTLSINVSL